MGGRRSPGDQHNLEVVVVTPPAALGPARERPDRAYCEDILRVLETDKIGYFFSIGGDDSADTVRIVPEARKDDDHLR